MRTCRYGQNQDRLSAVLQNPPSQNIVGAGRWKDCSWLSWDKTPTRMWCRVAENMLVCQNMKKMWYVDICLQQLNTHCVLTMCVDMLTCLFNRDLCVGMLYISSTEICISSTEICISSTEICVLMCTMCVDMLTYLFNSLTHIRLMKTMYSKCAYMYRDMIVIRWATNNRAHAARPYESCKNI